MTARLDICYGELRRNLQVMTKMKGAIDAFLAATTSTGGLKISFGGVG